MPAIYLCLLIATACLNLHAETDEASNELDELFPLKNAHEFKTEPDALAKINAIIDELKRGYGGTLVTSPNDTVLDSASFVAHFLRAFAKPQTAKPKDLKSYDYYFERLLSRLSQYPDALSEPLLDWDIFRAFLEYERFYKGSHKYKIDGTIYGLDSAKDLLWVYLQRHAKTIAADAKRRQWWIEQLSRGLEKSNQRPLRAWYLLLLVSESDSVTRIPAKKAPAMEPGIAHPTHKENTLTPSPWHVFIEWAENAPKPNTFVEAIQLLARSQELGHALLDIDPEKMSAPKILETNMSTRFTQFHIGYILDQESWSKKETYFRVSYSRPIGARSRAFSVNLPQPSQDGVFFFTYNGVLYVWKKDRMNDAALVMLRESSLLNAADYETLLKKGFKPLQKTLSVEFKK